MFNGGNMISIDTSALRSKRFGKRMVTTASTAVIASGGLILFCPPASVADSDTCTVAQTSYQAALAAAGAGAALSGQLAAATQVVTEAQQTRDALAAAAVADAVPAQADLDAAAAAATTAETDLASAQEDLQRALATARWAADRVDMIQTEFDGLPELNAAAEEKARTQLGVATAARSSAAADVTAAQALLEAATASQDQQAISAARADLRAKHELLRAAEAQLAAAISAVEGEEANGEAQLADARNRLEGAEQLWWEMDYHLMQAAEAFQAINDRADTAASVVTRARTTLLAAQNLEGIAAANAALAAASLTVEALHAQTTTPPDPASIERLLRSAVEACAATSEATPESQVAAATPFVEPMQATTVAQRAIVGLLLADRRQTTGIVAAVKPGQDVKTGGVATSNPEHNLPTGGVAAAKLGKNVQTGTITVPVEQASAAPLGLNGLATAGWSLGGLLVLSATWLGVRRIASKRRMT